MGEDEPVAVQDGPGVAVALARNGASVSVLRYEEVDFTYIPGDPPALRQVNFAVQRGQTVSPGSTSNSAGAQRNSFQTASQINDSYNVESFDFGLAEQHVAQRREQVDHLT